MSMTPEQVDKAIAYFKACWPQSYEWPEDGWDFWSDLFVNHGPSFVRMAFKKLLREGEYARFPPGLGAFQAALRDVEGYWINRRAEAEHVLRAAEGRISDAKLSVQCAEQHGDERMAEASRRELADAEAEAEKQTRYIMRVDQRLAQ